MEQTTLTALPDLAPPLVGLASGPGPAPALDEHEPARTFTALDAVLGREGLLLAQLCQHEPSSGRRGWWLLIHESTPSGTGTWPRCDLSRPGLRPPSTGARLAALAALGYEPANGTAAAWEWSETDALHSKTVLLMATMAVRRIAAAESAAAL
jgi:hypothetical protein